MVGLELLQFSVRGQKLFVRDVQPRFAQKQLGSNSTQELIDCWRAHSDWLGQKLHAAAQLLGPRMEP